MAGAASLGAAGGSGCAPSQRDAYYRAKGTVLQPAKGDGLALADKERSKSIASNDRR